MNTLKSIFTGLFLTIFLMSASPESENLTFGDWDKDSNDLISRSEFVEVFTMNYVDDWNVIDDDHLDDEDFYRVTYSIWDVDNDEMLSEEEWQYGYDYYYGDYILDDYVAIDTDGDGFIEYQEYYDVLYPTEYYMVWDVDEDTYLSELELARLVFNNWDINDNNFLELDEYQNFDSYYLDI